MINELSKRLGLTKVLGRTRERKVSMLQVMSRVIAYARQQREYLTSHHRANGIKARDRVEELIKKVGLDKCVMAELEGRVVRVVIDEEDGEDSLLDGCYVIKSDVPKEEADG